MKKYLLSLFALMACVVLLPSCEEDIEKRQVVFTATMPSDDLSSSRLGSIINGVPATDGFNLNAQWKEGDKIQIFVRQDGKVYQLESPAAISDISSDGKTCSFMVTLPKSVNRNKDYDIIGVTGVEANIDGENVIALCNMMRVGTERFNEILPMWFTAKKGSTQAKFRHLCTYEVLNVNNVSDASITFRHSGFKALSRWYIYSASILLSDGSIVGEQDVKNDAESDEITIPAGGTGTIVSWYIPRFDVTDETPDGTINNARLKAVVNGSAATSSDALKAYKNFARGNAYYMQATWDGSTLNFSNEFCPDGNHPHMIDLGLPSGIKCACCNIGAYRPSECGDYFAWGETVPKTNFTMTNYKWYSGGDDHNITKYCSNSNYGVVDNIIGLQLEDDAAYVNWGPEWRMPGAANTNELMENCTREWIKVNGMYGYILKSNTNNGAIFFPAAGRYIKNNIQEFEAAGYYWLRYNLYTSVPHAAYIVAFCNGEMGRLFIGYTARYCGCTIRPVYVGQE